MCGGGHLLPGGMIIYFLAFSILLWLVWFEVSVVAYEVMIPCLIITQEMAGRRFGLIKS